ncbi:MAG: PspC domain-containing protein [Marinilabiliaceae bacterium]|nr:PspC domain-containing protein [Marinilabiliaceae bacterium]
MKKIISINISSIAFFIDEDAYEILNQYFETLKVRFGTTEEGSEIITDIEARFAELFAERINPKTGVITITMVNESIKIMGQPDDFSENENREKKGFNDSFYAKNRSRRLYRDIENQKLGGVCAGIAAYFNIDPVVVRIIFVVLPFLSFGIIIPIYFALWIVVSPAVTASQKMEMKGENITISNIEKKIKEEYEVVKNQFENFKKNNKTYKKSENFFNNMKNRDKTILIIVCAFFLLLIFANFSSGCSKIYFNNSFFPVKMFFSGFITISVILLSLGLIFRSHFKVFAYIILIMAVVSVLIKLLIWSLSALNLSLWWI